MQSVIHAQGSSLPCVFSIDTIAWDCDDVSGSELVGIFQFAANLYQVTADPYYSVSLIADNFPYAVGRRIGFSVTELVPLIKPRAALSGARHNITDAYMTSSPSAADLYASSNLGTVSKA